MRDALGCIARYTLHVYCALFSAAAFAYAFGVHLTIRAKRLQLRLNAFSKQDTTVIGVGHSIGKAILLALVGGHVRLRSGQSVNTETDGRLIKLAPLAPPIVFFGAPGSLCSVRIPIEVWVGSADHITPPLQGEWSAQEQKSRQVANIHTIHGAGHFSFMDRVPPSTIEPFQDVYAFIREYASAICSLVNV